MSDIEDFDKGKRTASGNDSAKSISVSTEDKKKAYESKVFVGNLDFKTTSEDLEHLFMSYGAIIGVNVRNDRKTGKPKGFAFITFTSRSSAQAAIAEMNGKSYKGRALTVNDADVRGSGSSADRDGSSGSGSGSSKPSWITTPTPRKIEVKPQVDSADRPFVRDYSGGMNAGSAATGATGAVALKSNKGDQKASSSSSSRTDVCCDISVTTTATTATAEATADEEWDGVAMAGKSKGKNKNKIKGKGSTKTAGGPVTGTGPNLWTSWAGPA